MVASQNHNEGNVMNQFSLSAKTRYTLYGAGKTLAIQIQQHFSTQFSSSKNSTIWQFMHSFPSVYHVKSSDDLQQEHSCTLCSVSHPSPSSVKQWWEPGFLKMLFKGRTEGRTDIINHVFWLPPSEWRTAVWSSRRRRVRALHIFQSSPSMSSNFGKVLL